jgi:hypothetical protein
LQDFLVADFTQLCYDSRWYAYLPLAIAGVVVYPLGIPFVLFFALYRVRNRLKRPEVIVAYGIGTNSECNALPIITTDSALDVKPAIDRALCCAAAPPARSV